MEDNIIRRYSSIVSYNSKDTLFGIKKSYYLRVPNMLLSMHKYTYMIDEYNRILCNISNEDTIRIYSENDDIHIEIYVKNVNTKTINMKNIYCNYNHIFKKEREEELVNFLNKMSTINTLLTNLENMMKYYPSIVIKESYNTPKQYFIMIPEFLCTLKHKYIAVNKKLSFEYSDAKTEQKHYSDSGNCYITTIYQDNKIDIENNGTSYEKYKIVINKKYVISDPVNNYKLINLFDGHMDLSAFKNTQKGILTLIESFITLNEFLQKIPTNIKMDDIEYILDTSIDKEIEIKIKEQAANLSHYVSVNDAKKLLDN